MPSFPSFFCLSPLIALSLAPFCSPLRHSLSPSLCPQQIGVLLLASAPLQAVAPLVSFCPSRFSLQPTLEAPPSKSLRVSLDFLVALSSIRSLVPILLFPMGACFSDSSPFPISNLRRSLSLSLPLLALVLLSAAPPPPSRPSGWAEPYRPRPN